MVLSVTQISDHIWYNELKKQQDGIFILYSILGKKAASGKCNDWADLQLESQKIQLLFCWSLTAPLKSNISTSSLVWEREDLGQEVLPFVRCCSNLWVGFRTGSKLPVVQVSVYCYHPGYFGSPLIHAQGIHLFEWLWQSYYIQWV